MNSTAQKLLDAHVAFFVEKLSGKQIKKTVGDEAKIIYKWVAAQHLSDIFTQDRVKDFLKRQLDEAVITDSTKAYAESLLEAVLDDIAKNNIDIGDVISKDTWDRIVDKAIQQKELRNELVHRLISNKAYGEMLSEIIYNSIKSFMQQNPFGGNNSDKGLGGLFNVGKSLLGSALSGVEDSIDKNVKKFLSDNINKTLRDSEKIIQARLTDENLKRIADKAWNRLDRLNFKEIAQKAKKYSSSGKDSTSELVSTVLLEAKDSKAFTHIADFILNHFYETYGDQPIKVLLDGLDITEKKVARESVHIAEDILNQMNKTGFLEERVREHLKEFYESKDVESILK